MTSSSGLVEISDDAIEHRVGHLLRRAYYRAKANTGSLLRELHVTPTQGATLMALAQHGELSQADLGRAIGMEPANVHSLVDRLKALRYVALRAHPGDARQVRVALTSAGAKRAVQVASLTARSAALTLDPLDAEERATFLALLARVALEPQAAGC